jgi:peptidoglycan/LPS O-acetylase OafA/YrhL
VVPERLKPLDGLRGIAILLVMLVHFGHGTHPNALVHLLFKAAYAGWVGVDLFFVLSGFLITRILLATRTSPFFFRDFWMRRVLRIFPLTYGVLTVVLLLAPLVTRARALPAGPSPTWLWLYASNIYPLVTGDWFNAPNVLGLNFGHFWSLGVEEQFYLLWPLMVWRIGPRNLPRLCGVLAFSCICLRLVFVAEGVSPNAIYTFTLCRMDALLAGAWIAGVAANGGRLARGVPLARLLAVVSLAVLIGSMAVTGNTFWPGRFMQTAGYSLLAILFGAVVVLAIAAPASSAGRRLLESRVLTFFGKYSYGLYVLHALLWPLFDLGALSVESLSARLDSYLLGVLAHASVATAVSMGAAILSWHLYESRFLKLKRYFNYSVDEPLPLEIPPLATASRRPGG